VIVSKRPSWDKFPGAEYTVALDVLMPDGKTLQVGTVHNLGTNFAKTFDITYEDKNGEQQYVNQTCYGISERCIASLISIHGDDGGLVLPPEVAPVQVVVVPILFKHSEDVMESARKLSERLSKEFRVVLDDSEKRPGAKFYEWELRGVPVRLELGPRDLERGEVVIAPRVWEGERRRSVDIDAVEEEIKKEFENIEKILYEKALSSLKSGLKLCSTIEEAKEQVMKGIAIVGWCGEEECGHVIEEKCSCDVLGEPVGSEYEITECVVCGRETDRCVFLGRPY